MQKIFTVIAAALVLGACSPETLFSMLARSDIEQAASESVEQTGQIINQIEQKITTLKSQYATSTKLESTSGDGSYAYAFITTNQQPSLKLAIIAVLPPLESNDAYYEAWLKDPDTFETMTVGPLFLDETDQSRQLQFTSNQDISNFTEIIITAQNSDGSKMGEVVVAGKINQ